jgi:hypothetical protein
MVQGKSSNLRVVEDGMSLQVAHYGGHSDILYLVLRQKVLSAPPAASSAS